MKKGKVFFHPIDGSGALTISWSSRPKGDAVEARTGSGVGFFSEKGDLLCVIFDEVRSDNDHQILTFTQNDIEITVQHGQVTYSIAQRSTTSSIPKSRVKKKPPMKRQKQAAKNTKK